MGVVRSRHGSGTFIPDGPPSLGSEPLSFLAALHGFSGEDMYESRRVLEVAAAGLSAERATPDELATLADAVASLFAVMNDAQAFHRIVASSSGNPILAALIDMVSALYYERRRKTAERAANRDLRAAADAHRRIYQAIRSRDADGARRAMHDHLVEASGYQAQESGHTRDPQRRRRRTGES